MPNVASHKHIFSYVKISIFFIFWNWIYVNVDGIMFTYEFVFIASHFYLFLTFVETLSKLKEKPFVIKEGAEYKLKIVFRVGIF